VVGQILCYCGRWYAIRNRCQWNALPRQWGSTALVKRVGAYGWVVESLWVFFNIYSCVMEIIMNISYANNFPSVFCCFLTLVPRKMAFVSSSLYPASHGDFRCPNTCETSDAPTPAMRRLNACEETTQHLWKMTRCLWRDDSMLAICYALNITWLSKCNFPCTFL